jgi:predicted DNA-binding protein with PD1-like motif
MVAGGTMTLEREGHVNQDKRRYTVGDLGRVVVMRLGPGDDILPAILEIAAESGVRQGVILGGAASLTQARLRNVRRYPEQFPITDEVRVFSAFEGPLELLSLSGNISQTAAGDAYIHCHAAISTGQPDAMAYGGHLLPETMVFSTAELSLVEVRGCDILRLDDPETCVGELYFRPWAADA